MKKLLLNFLQLLQIILAVILIAGFFGKYWGLFDSLSHFRVQQLELLLLITIIIAILKWNKSSIFYIIFAAALSAYYYFFTLPFIPPIKAPIKGTFTHLQFNTNFQNSKMDEVVKFINNSNIDTITMQEITPKHLKTLEELKSQYKYKHFCKYANFGGVMIISKHPIIDNTKSCEKGYAKAQVKIKNTKVNIVSIHLFWPYPFHQASQIKKLEPLLESLKGPTLIAGDFNAASWSYALKRVTKASKTDIINGLRYTIKPKELPFNIMLPIDHILLKNLIAKDIKVGSQIGSDHYMVISKIGILQQ